VSKWVPLEAISIGLAGNCLQLLREARLQALPPFGQAFAFLLNQHFSSGVSKKFLLKKHAVTIFQSPPQH
jgi:hypothetical protein